MKNLKKWIAAVLVIVLVAPALPARVEGTQVMYVGGTIQHLSEGTVGKLDTQQVDKLVFEWPEGKLEVPYKEISSFEYSEKLARRMGALPTIAVVLVKRRQRRHFVEITFQNAEGTPQVAVLEIPKTMVQPVVAVLETRTSHLCKTPGSDSHSTTLNADACRFKRAAVAN